MDREKLTGAILAGLLDLENANDLVITHPTPAYLAERLASLIIKSCIGELSGVPPFELHIHDSLVASARFIHQEFGAPESEAKAIVEQFHAERRAERTLSEFSDLVWHQGDEDLALGAYFSVALKLGMYYSSEYLDWRQEFYAKRRARNKAP